MAPSRHHSHGRTVKRIWIPVLGILGVGKSTFTYHATGDTEIRIGKDEDMGGITRAAQDFICYYTYNDVEYEIHLIDTPGFDDEVISDIQNLASIATHLNNTYKENHEFAGVLYLHDITKTKVDREEVKNLKMLRGLLGNDNWGYCTVVTTKWHPALTSQQEAREKTLSQTDQYFGAMLHGRHKAKMERFYPVTKEKALEIIQPMLERHFVPKLCQQMVDSRIKLYQTDAGSQLDQEVQQPPSANGRDPAMFQAARNLLREEYDERLHAMLQEMLVKDRQRQQERRHLQVKHRWQEAGCCAVRTVIIGGGITATILTMGPGATIFGLMAIFEPYAQRLRKHQRNALKELEEKYGRSQAPGPSHHPSRVHAPQRREMMMLTGEDGRSLLDRLLNDSDSAISGADAGDDEI